MAHSQNILKEYNENKVYKLKLVVHVLTALALLSVVFLTSYVIVATVVTQE